MTRLTLNAKAHGQTAGTALTSGSGGNTAALGSHVDAVTLAGTGSVTFQGTDVVRFTDPAGASNVARLDWNDRLNGDRFSLELEANGVPAPGNGEMRVVTVRNPGNTTDLIRVQITATRTVRIYDGNNDLKWESTTTLPTGAGWRLHAGGVLSTGTVTANIYTASDGKSSTAAQSSGNVTGFAWGGATGVGGMRFGSITSAADLTWDLRNARIDDATASPLGALADLTLTGDPAQILGANFTGQVNGTAPYTMTGSRIAGPTVGTISTAGVVGWFARPTEPVTIRWTITDATAAQVVADVVHDPGGTTQAVGGGPLTWDGTAWV